MSHSNIPLNPGIGPNQLDAELLTVGSTPVLRERMQLAGKEADEIVSMLNDVPAPSANPYAVPVRSVPGPIVVIETTTANLVASGIYNSAIYDCARGSVFSVFLRMDKQGLIRFQESHNGSTWENMIQIPTVADVACKEPSYLCSARYFRIVLKNTEYDPGDGSGTTTDLRLQISQRFSNIGSRQSLQWPIYATRSPLLSGTSFQPGDHFSGPAGDYPTILIYLKSDQDGTLKIRESADEVNWLDTSYDYSGGSDPMRVTYRRTTAHLHVIYTNGPSMQTSFFFFASMSNI